MTTLGAMAMWCIFFTFEMTNFFLNLIIAITHKYKHKILYLCSNKLSYDSNYVYPLATVKKLTIFIMSLSIFTSSIWCHLQKILLITNISRTWCHSLTIPNYLIYMQINLTYPRVLWFWNVRRVWKRNFLRRNQIRIHRWPEGVISPVITTAPKR
jgi:hypothetical protein